MKLFRTSLASRTAIVAALGLACWPVVRWYVARLGDGSDEPWGLAALLAALIFAPRTGGNEPLARNRMWLLCGLVATYILTYAVVPPLGRALLFVTLVGAAAGRGRFPLAWWALLVLSLPLVATLQFYLGYPLRLATTALCTPLLRLGGLHVVSNGTVLRWAGETVIVDAPCSGIHMLWTGLFLAATLACRQRRDNRAAFRLLHRAGLIVFAANVLRATILFCTETKLWPAPSWAHEGVGLALFGAAAVAIYLASDTKTGTDGAAPPSEPIGNFGGRAAVPALALLISCLVAALVPLRLTAPRHDASLDTFSGWTSAPLPAGANAIPLGAREARFAADFPGQIGAFNDGEHTWVVRWIRRPTRKLHPALHCLRASGYTVHPQPIFVRPDGTQWGTLRAQRAGENIRVEERIIDAAGGEWTDVSEWFWATALERSTGPWWAVTVFMHEKNGGDRACAGAGVPLQSRTAFCYPGS